MRTYEILHEVGIEAAPEAVYRALTETGQLAGWWTSDTRGNGSVVGGLLEFWFGENCHRFEVVELQPGRLVRWRAKPLDSSDEWRGTEVRFLLEAGEHQCYVQFRHAGWPANDGSFPHTSTKWAVFLLSLKDLLETGRGRPAPADLQVNHD